MENTRSIVEKQLPLRTTPTKYGAGFNESKEIGRKIQVNREGKSSCGEIKLGSISQEGTRRSLDASEQDSVRTNITPPDVISLEMENYMKSCVRHHETLITCCSETQSIFSPATAFQIILAALLAVIALFISILVRKAGGEIDLIIIAVIFSMAGTSEFFIMCIFCNKLTERSSSIRQAVYACDWTEASEGFKLSLRIIISRTSRPIIFRAIGVPLSLRTFRAVMRAVYYTYTMALNIIDGKKIIEKRC